MNDKVRSLYMNMFTTIIKLSYAGELSTKIKETLKYIDWLTDNKPTIECIILFEKYLDGDKTNEN